MVEFNNDAELWKFLLAGGTVVEKCVGISKRKLYLNNGNKTYSTGESARNCLLTYNYWVGIPSSIAKLGA